MTLDVRVCRDGELGRAPAGRSTRRASRRPAGSGCSRSSSRSTAARCRAFGCDGVVVRHADRVDGVRVLAPAARSSGPTSTALLLVPISAHALFARPLVVGPRRVLAVEVLDRSPAPACCGATVGVRLELPLGARVEVRRGARRPCGSRGCTPAPFTDRLVDKFGLPVDGWRGRPRRRPHGEGRRR